MGSPDGTVFVDISNNLVNKINNNLEALPGIPMIAEKFTIFRVPANIRQKYKELYEPRMVSIGPYYNGKDELHAMEKHKWRYLRDYLSRNNSNNIERCIGELTRLESLARTCYFEDVKLQSDEFLMMLLLDGCFIIEFLIKWYSPGEALDPLFNVSWALPVIRSDLLLLENQIPFFVIQKLFDLLTCSCSYPVPADENVSVSTPVVPIIAPLVEMFVDYLSERNVGAARPILSIIEIKHILHLYHICYVTVERPNEHLTRTYDILGWLNPMKLVFGFLMFFLKICYRRTDNQNISGIIPSAIELNEAGVIFKCRQSENILDIKFQNGTLEIPFLSIEEAQRARLLSLVCFEQQDNNVHRNLTSYVHFMGSLCKTARDVTLLEQMGIVSNLLATNEELVLFFIWLTQLGNFLAYEGDHLKDHIRDVNMRYLHYMSDWYRWKAILKRDYFSNPWSTISLTAALVLLALTVLQTLYTILSYY